MKLTKQILFLMFAFPLICSAKTLNQEVYTVPFSNITVPDEIIAKYAFAPEPHDLICYVSTGSATFSWTYKGNEYITEGTEGMYIGFSALDSQFNPPADLVGDIRIKNTSKQQLIVGCHFFD